MSASHRQRSLGGELAQIAEQVRGCRRKLRGQCAPSLTGPGQLEASAVERQRDVDACLQQVEHLLLSALVRRQPRDVDTYVTRDVTPADRPAAGDGRSLDERLRQATRENKELRRRVERLDSRARSLRGHNVALRTELDRLRAADRNFRAELGEFLPVSGSVDVNSVTEAVREIESKARQLQATNSSLQARVAQLGCTSVGESCELETKINELEAERGTLLRRQNELQPAVEVSRQRCGTTSSVTNDTDSWASRSDKLETEHRDICAATQLSAQQEQEEHRTKVDEEKKLLIHKIDTLELEAKKKEAIFDRLEHESEIIRRQNDELTRKISELDTTDASTASEQFFRQENDRLKDDIEALNEAMCRQSKLILQMDEKLRHYQHSRTTATATALKELPQTDSASEDVADVLRRLEDQSTELEKALATREMLCRDLDVARKQNARLSGVVDDLRAECERKDSDAVRLRADVSQLEQRLAVERREFVDTVQLVRRENAAECDKIAQDNRRLATLFAELHGTQPHRQQ